MFVPKSFSVTDVRFVGLSVPSGGAGNARSETDQPSDAASVGIFGAEAQGFADDVFSAAVRFATVAGDAHDEKSRPKPGFFKKIFPFARSARINR